ncbi:hypothetical protein M758_6G167000 [Ceratodon purpureus]|nr:hypothetical protein M758_6G167000 [Ceratodon purpureus]
MCPFVRRDVHQPEFSLVMVVLIAVLCRCSSGMRMRLEEERRDLEILFGEART